MFSQGSIHVGLISAATLCLFLEPIDYIGIYSNSYLFFDWSIKDATPGIRPIKHFGDIRRVDLVIRQLGNFCHIRRLLGRSLFRNQLHIRPFLSGSLFERC